MSSQDALDIDQTGLLSDATLSALQISQQAFASQQGQSEADHALFSDEVTAEQLADIKQALITGDDLLLILGEEGAGKTTLLSQLGANSGLRIQCFAVKGSPRFSTMNLFAGMLEAFKRKPPETLKQILDELIPCLQTMVSRNTLSAIVLDDAHKVNETELTQLLSGMLYVNSQDETLMRVALAAPSDFENRIPDLLPEGADLPYSSLTIDGLSPHRASAYVAFRLAQSGFTGEFPFTEREMANLIDQSAGLPAALHIAVADDLNKRHGLIDDSLPAELMSQPEGAFLHSRLGKLALGAVATAFIIAGIILFLNPADEQNSDRYTVASQDAEETDDPARELKLLKNEPVVLSDEDSGTENQPSTAPVPESPESMVPVASTPVVDERPDQAIVPEPIPEPMLVPLEETSEVAAAEPAPEPVPAPEPPPQPLEEPASDAQPDATSSEPSTELVEAEPVQPEETAGESQESTDTTGTAAIDATKAPGFLESPNWILVQNPDQFTVQMSASTDRPSVENFLKRNPLNPPNSIFSFDRNGVTWYALVHGLFASIDEARQAVESMPPDALTNQPWIRSVGRVQSVLKAQ